MKAPQSPGASLFPCPFCQSTRVILTGGGGRFLHYRCDGCAEVWTALGTLRQDAKAS